MTRTQQHKPEFQENRSEEFILNKPYIFSSFDA